METTPSTSNNHPQAAPHAALGDIAPRTRAFIEALTRCESLCDPLHLVDRFAQDCELESVAFHDHEPIRGRHGAHQFWHSYLSQFAKVNSRFTRALERGDHVVLEWVSDCQRHDGTPFCYRGVSLLDFDGEHVRCFRTYFDTAMFAKPQAKRHSAHHPTEAHAH